MGAKEKTATRGKTGPARCLWKMETVIASREGGRDWKNPSLSPMVNSKHSWSCVATMCSRKRMISTTQKDQTQLSYLLFVCRQNFSLCRSLDVLELAP